MSDKKRINTRNLVEKIDKVVKERIAQKQVVSLEDFRKFRERGEPDTIMLIDDDETVRAALRRLLEAEGYHVLTAESAPQLSEVLTGHPIDLIILDVGLPWINGFELAQMMKENEDLKKIPLVFLSAHKTEVDVKRGFQVGAADYIKKPFDIAEVKRTIKTLLELNKK